MFRVGEEIPFGYCQCGCGEKAPIATRTAADRGWVKGEPTRCLRWHKARGQQFEVRDCGYETPCWVWIRATYPEGYGNIRASGKNHQAHRVVYEQYKGPIPDGLEIDHLCRNHPCVNPDHLEPVTHAENNRRGARARLSPRLAAEIRASAKGHSELARELGVGATTVFMVRRGLTWKEGVV